MPEAGYLNVFGGDDGGAVAQFFDFEFVMVVNVNVVKEEDYHAGLAVVVHVF